jgi:hypothetical protein
MNGKQISLATTRSYCSTFCGEYMKYISVYFSELNADILFERRNRSVDYSNSVLNQWVM